MSKRNTILLSLLVLALLLAGGFYFFQKNSGPRPLTQEEIEELQRKELMSYVVDPTNQKSEAEQKKELEQFVAPSSESPLTEEEMRKILTSEETVVR
ncbi:MAG: hypothetical protein M3Q34_04650 [bacterium]|nr:hypothetical protein [bacterium]